MPDHLTWDSYRDLVAWQKSIDLCLEVYDATNRFPDSERFGLTAEIRKTARSVAYNIAEGQRRTSTRDFARFLDIARGSQAEVRTQIILAGKLGYLDDQTNRDLTERCDEVGALLYALVAAIRTRNR